MTRETASAIVPTLSLATSADCAVPRNIGAGQLSRGLTPDSRRETPRETLAVHPQTRWQVLPPPFLRDQAEAKQADHARRAVLRGAVVYLFRRNQDEAAQVSPRHQSRE